MHKCVMNMMGWLKEEYGCPEKMTTCDLKELHCWSETLLNILKADKLYMEIEEMHENNEN